MSYTWTAENPLVDDTDYPQAAMFNEIRDILDHMNNYKASAYMSTNQSIPDSVGTTVAFDTIIYDPSSGFSTSTHKYTCPIAGFYFVSFLGNFAYNSAGTRSLGIEKNGTTAWEVQTGAQGSTNSPSTGAFLSNIVQCSASDTLNAYVYQNSGGALNLIGDSDHCIFNVHFLSTN